MVDSILDSPPTNVADRALKLRSSLDEVIPPKRLDDNLLIATWNIRAFGDLTEKWEAQEGDSPKRDLQSVLYIDEIVSRFDVIAIQEVKGNIKALRHLLKRLGSDWGLILTDVTVGARGNDERMAYLFDTRRVKPSGLACEVVVPEEWINDTSSEALRRQFARTPYAISLAAGKETLILVTLHVVYGDSASDRTEELRGIAQWLADWAKREDSWGHNLIVLGDFNIDRQGDANYDAFTSTGLRPPKELEDIPRTIFKDGKDKYYDQIAWFCEAGDVPLMTLEYDGHAGFFDFAEALPTEDRLGQSWKMSDHYPLWAEFKSPRSQI
jgi:endonuclease/exonuclease/phosphatase family metal-dependent hydrolase